MHKEIIEEIEIPEGVEITIEGSLFKVKGKKGELDRNFQVANVKIDKKNNVLEIIAKKATKREKKMIYTVVAHIKNMIKGVKEGYKYKLQIASLHFPMNVRFDKEKNVVEIKNFLGETKERLAKIFPGVEVKIEKEFITLEGIDKEKVGQSAANIETASKVRNKDKRIFQDGIWIIEKNDKNLLE
ncbi:50S ribosomal protein L6 [Candidatus Pacearchaeota archaeon CG_4_9_14_3_um_filter_31_7]|nr:MAG: 50S ribosomal protein L6 [Candidatus Pacearchaeota archaeon CG1_02_31_27]PIZ80675.1 MAG: 50S ribosomal protein L6 [Candidatus Pacearchaeota archaeon CG_4_10_14_0_2_um_filter_31_10]PJA70799.1 MAG: 50S ribosomal protein L6 [Candidatus Pacearchaeota archaeon CG_4_9_14_3_um_filter_31_7]